MSDAQTCGEILICVGPKQPSPEIVRAGRPNVRRHATCVPPFARNEGRTAKTCVQLRFRCQTQPFHTNGGQMQFCNVRREWQKSAIKLRFGNVSCNPLVRNVKLLCVKASLCKGLCVYKLLSVNAFVYESCCVKASLCKIFIFSA